jgi:predicted HD superfamily hydrolase involved in NAD metabolism
VGRSGIRHCENVAVTAAELTVRFGGDGGLSYVAGLGHDVARGLPENTLLQQARAMGIWISPEAARGPLLLHGEVGARMLRDAGVTYPVVLEATRHHILGGPGLLQEARAIYAADLLEPGRTFARDLWSRAARLTSLDEVVLFVARALLNHYEGQGPSIGEPTLAMIEELEGRIAAR